MKKFERLGFIGVGVMGEPICRHLATKSGISVIAYDLDTQPLERLAAHGVVTAGSAAEVMGVADVVFLSLPSGEAVRRLAQAEDGLLAHARPEQVVVDTSTSDLSTTRDLAREFLAKGATFIDAPVARTRSAAEAGMLAVMVGADRATFERVRPLIATYASDIALCGDVGCGQVLKILNNMLLFQTVAALSEAKVVAERAGVDAKLLFDVLSTGSADSFALRNHGMKAVLPREFPPRSFSVEYARKDLRYGLQLARDVGMKSRWGEDVDELFQRAIEGGRGGDYWPVVSLFVGDSASDAAWPAEKACA